MLSWFKPRCPLDLWEKAWIEYRLRWIVNRFGLTRWLNCEIALPLDLWPVDFTGSEDDARTILSRLCRRMDLPADRFRLEVLDDVQLPGAAGHYDAAAAQPVIRIKHSQLADPLSLTAVLAHEAAHDVLLAGGYQSGAETDLELTTDLLPVFFGVGLFAANSTVRSVSGRTGNWEFWSISRQGYLPSRMFGYAFAHMAWFRNESEGFWTEQLRSDAAEPFTAGIQYLTATGDSLFHPERYTADRPPIGGANVIHDLADKSPTVRLAALWDAALLDPTDAPLVAAVAGRLRDREPSIIAEAVQLLVRWDRVDEAASVEIVRLLDERNETVLLPAIAAVGELQLRPAESLDALRFTAVDERVEVATASVQAIGKFGRAAEKFQSLLVKSLAAANIRGDAAGAEVAAAALAAVVDSPREVLREFYASGDAELHRQARTALDAVLRRTPPSNPA